MLTVWCGRRDTHERHVWEIPRADEPQVPIISRCTGVTKQEADDIAAGKTEGGAACHTLTNG